MGTNMRKHGIRMLIAGVLAGFILGLAVASARADLYGGSAHTINYATKTVSVYLAPDEDVASFPCPDGWKWEIYRLVIDVENKPAMKTVLFEKGVCGE